MHTLRPICSSETCPSLTVSIIWPLNCSRWYATDWGRGSAVHANPAPQYDPLRRAQADIWANLPAVFIGKTVATGPAILQVVDAAEPPTRILFGLTPTKNIVDVYAKRLQTWKEREAVSIAANGH